MKKAISYISIFTLVIATFAMSLSAQAQENPAPNPQLGDACGLDIALLLDMTGSIGDQVDTVKTAAKDFVDAFLPDTPTMIGIVEFSNGSASEVQDLTDDAADLKADIDGLSAAGTTNWEAALQLGRAMLEGGLDRDDSEHPDLIIIISDGNPNVPSGTALDDAIIEANAAKTSSASMPIRIVGIGVGDVTVDSLVAISGTNVNDDPITKDTDVITGNFEDLASILGELAAALCEDTCPESCDSGPDIVINNNEAVVVNRVEANANTGGNYAGGSYGGDGGNAGDIRNSGDDVEGSTTGNGGTGGNGSTGGTIYTGDASSRIGILNVVNTNDTEIDRCACDDCCDTGATFTMNRNRAMVMNGAETNANTGENIADGSEGGDAGDGGDIKNGQYRQIEEGGDVQDSNTGTGGDGGSAGLGGYIETGAADSTAEVINVVNRNITRVRR